MVIMGKLVEEAQKAYDDFWSTLKSSDLTKVDMNTAMATKTTLEINIDKAIEKEKVFEDAASAAIIAFDTTMRQQLLTKQKEIATLESKLSVDRTTLETLWNKKRVEGNYNIDYTE